ncbi:MAG: 4Fe-4S binding protein [Clostridia bacterium]|nr:4Fe-4S binding protein [Clostridia bacterium]
MFFGASNGVGILPTPNSGFRTLHPEIDSKACIKCMMCWVFCPEGCIDKSGDHLEIDMDYCKGCGICAAECPKNCIKMVKDGDTE